MKNVRKMKICIIALLGIIMHLQFLSCSDDKSKGNSYDPNKPIEIASFYPDSGYIGTKVILEGSNFGNDPSRIEAYFNEKKAAVVGVSNDKMYLLTPKLPGDNCEIRIKIDGQEVTSGDKYFRYKSGYSVETVCGKQGSSSSRFVEGDLASTILPQGITYMCIDHEDNVLLYMGENSWGGSVYTLALINEKDNRTRAIYQTSDKLNMPTVDHENGLFYYPGDVETSYVIIDKNTMWSAKTYMFRHPNAEEQAAGMLDFKLRWKHSFAFSTLDINPETGLGYVYTRCYDGDLIKIDMKKRMAFKVAVTRAIESDSFCIFDPNNPSILYIIYSAGHCIDTYNIVTKEYTQNYAGFYGRSGYQDGPKQDALFNWPHQMCIDQEGNLFIADSGNHCIRKISPSGIVSTIVGIGGRSGYQDGNPEDALFSRPWGMCVASNGSVYVADQGNSCVRKLTYQ